MRNIQRWESENPSRPHAAQAAVLEALFDRSLVELGFDGGLRSRDDWSTGTALELVSEKVAMEHQTRRELLTNSGAALASYLLSWCIAEGLAPPPTAETPRSANELLS
jgi:hypothetical protein